jgi:asparagine synthase (glutamine-hydrolysing)
MLHILKSYISLSHLLPRYKRDGFKALSSLRGEFAFVLYDSQKQLLFAARDRFGIKPLNYTLSNGALLLASELKALPALGWKPEWDIDSIVNTGYMCDDRTVFKGVKKVCARCFIALTELNLSPHQLMPGQFLTFRSGGELRVETYWDIEYPSALLGVPTPSPPTIEEMIAGVRTRLIEAVRLRLRADVPVALYLSGGIDSAAVAGIATELLREEDPNAKLTTFTLAFPRECLPSMTSLPRKDSTDLLILFIGNRRERPGRGPHRCTHRQSPGS